ncbi:hypothetical protein PHET_12484 [Paragonimus heterotremus]|uniref:Uncharacterized protein n=1 Tax=Paragonimus heterotremus TaxID=100268 RepID=A0A8J4SMT0_9TREM|nr:hypothetical protein PHET_12484 [Paragonimus heterotremus]
MGLRNRSMRNKFILKSTESLSVALIRARGCEALEQLDEKRAAEESICLAFSQHSLNAKPIPRPNRPVIPTREECCYCQQSDRRAQHCGHNPPIRPSPRKGESMIISYEALSSVISPEIVVNMKSSSVRGSINKEAILFLVDTGVSRSLIRAQLVDRLTKHRRAPVKPVRLLAANGT